MKKINQLFILSTIILTTLTGCYDYREMNTLAIVSATEINKIGDEYQVSVQAINPQAPDKTAVPQAPFIIYTGTGKTIQEAYRSITLSASRFMYSNHLDLLIINEKIAKENISYLIDYYIRNPGIRTEFYVLISKDDNILSVTTPIDEISSASIKESIENNYKYYGVSSRTTFSEFVNMNLNPNQEIVLPTIELVKDTPTEDKNINEEKNNNEDINANKDKDNNENNDKNKSNNSEDKNNKSNQEENESDGTSNKNTEKTEIKNKYLLGGYAIFKNNKLIGYLNNKESINYNIITNNIKNTIITYECFKNKYLAIEITDSSSSIKTKNNKVSIDINLKGNINESHCDIDITKNKNIKKISHDIEKKLNKEITNDILNVRDNYHTDIYKFKDIIYKHDYSYYQKIKNNYDEAYQNLDISVKTNIQLVEKGNILEVINEKDK
jgi:germination protein, ger(x)C family